MTTIVYKYSGPASELRPLMKEWENEAGGYGYEFNETELTDMVSDFSNMDNKALFVLSDGPDIVGVIMGELEISRLDGKLQCQERLWYCKPEYRGQEAVELKYALETWARRKHCKRFFMNACKLGSDKFDSLCRLYERDMELFETTYVKVLC